MSWHTVCPCQGVSKLLTATFVHIFYTLAEPLVLPLHLISSVMVGLWVES